MLCWFSILPYCSYLVLSIWYIMSIGNNRNPWCMWDCRSPIRLSVKTYLAYLSNSLDQYFTLFLLPSTAWEIHRPQDRTDPGWRRVSHCGFWSSNHRVRVYTSVEWSRYASSPVKSPVFKSESSQKNRSQVRVESTAHTSRVPMDQVESKSSTKYFIIYFKVSRCNECNTCSVCIKGSKSGWTYSKIG